MATNLEFISRQEITTSVSLLDFDNVFSDKYDVYKITSSNINTASTSASDNAIRLLDSTGTVIDQTEYDYAQLILRAETTFGEGKNTNQTSIPNFFALTDQKPEGMGTVGYIYNPFDSGSYTFFLHQNSFAVDSVTRGLKGIGVHKSAESCRGFRAIFEFAVDSGFISVYGLASN